MRDRVLIELRNARIGHGRDAVLSDVSLKVRVGEFWGVFGYNGSGKTTLLRTVLGLNPLMGGGLELRGVSSESLRYGYVPQERKMDSIYPLTSFAVAEMGAFRGFGLTGPEGRRKRRRLVEGCLAECGALDFGDHLFSGLSGGQKQRVLLARALAAEPDVLVLDEPLAGIDVATQRVLLELLRKLKESRGLTVVLVSHRLREERGLLSHIAWLEDGIVESGPAEEMLADKVGEVFKGEL